MPTYAAAAEALGFDGFWVAETNSDPFLNLALAAEHSRQMTLGTAIAVAFPRSPAILALSLIHIYATRAWPSASACRWPTTWTTLAAGRHAMVFSACKVLMIY